MACRGQRREKEVALSDGCFLSATSCLCAVTFYLYSFSCRLLSSGFEVQPVQEVAEGEMVCGSVQEVTRDNKTSGWPAVLLIIAVFSSFKAKICY